jgi:threonine/homoserine/homoserine lactone efflux protein
VHAAYSLVGIGLIISNSIVLFSTLKFICAGYLIYTGFRSLQTKQARDTQQIGHPAANAMRPSTAIRMGFLTKKSLRLIHLA